jgi:signal peptidase I
LRVAFFYISRIAVAIAVIIGVFKLYKYHDSVTIDPTNYGMDQTVYPPGTYRVDVYATDPKQLKAGDVVAYYIPGQHVEVRVARVAAIEGQHVEFTGEQVLIDGKQTKFLAETIKFPEIVVPRGTVYVMLDQPRNGNDSSRLGPLHSYEIYGRLK